MMGYIQGQAPKTKGQWDVAAVPGGGGNWGGSFLTIPKQSQHPKEAWELIKFLTVADLARPSCSSRRATCPASRSSTPTRDRRFTNPFFNNAPVGQIFTGGAQKLQPQVTGPKQGDIQTAAEPAIQRVEEGKQTPDQSWPQFLKDVQNLTA